MKTTMPIQFAPQPVSEAANSSPISPQLGPVEMDPEYRTGQPVYFRNYACEIARGKVREVYGFVDPALVVIEEEGTGLCYQLPVCEVSVKHAGAVLFLRDFLRSRLEMLDAGMSS